MSMTFDEAGRDVGSSDEADFLEGLTVTGLRLVEPRTAAGLIPVNTAWMATTCLPGEGGRSDVTFEFDDPRLIENVNETWLRLASEHGLFDESGVFLLSVSLGVADPGPPHWAAVSLMDRFDIAGVGAEVGIFGFERGKIEFTTASKDGRVVIRGTMWQDAVGLLVLTQANLSERLRLFTQGMLDRGVLPESERRQAELWLLLD
jgi:hypothetical protein